MAQAMVTIRSVFGLPPIADRALGDAMAFLADAYRQDLLGQHDDGTAMDPQAAIFEHLPPRYAAAYNVAFAQRYALCVTMACYRIAAREKAACIAEDLAILTILELATHMVEDRFPREAGHAAEELQGLAAIVSQSDVRWLWNALAAREASDVSAWFRAYRENHPVHPLLHLSVPSI